MARPKKVVEDSTEVLENKSVELVEMVRDGETNPGPTTAKVHPDEVDNWKKFGWMIKE